jgi:spermidine synthase
MIRKYSLEIIVFISGAVVLILEIVASRVLAPYVGTSIIAWTSIIGSILASLSIGYWLGGALADAHPTYKRFASFLFLSAVLIALMAWGKEFILIALGSIESLQTRSLLSALLLFAPPSIVLGMISPFAIRLRMHEVATSGHTVGRLYAISTIGSIVGTFATGFYLLAHFGSTTILYLLAIAQIICVLLVVPHFWKRSAASVIVLIFLMIWGSPISPVVAEEFHDIDTAYHRIWIYDLKDPYINETVRYLDTDSYGHQSGMILERPNELVFEYTKMYRLAEHFVPKVSKALLMGGGGYSYAKNFLQQFPQGNLDIIEIDPGLTELARKYFALPHDSRLSIYHEDARMFVNRSTSTYDVIIGDAFRSSYSIPHHLTTREAVQRYYDLLEDEGVMLLNVIGSLDGVGSIFVSAEYATFKSIFPQVYVFPIDPSSRVGLQNILFVVGKSEKPLSLVSAHPEMAEYLGRRWNGTFTEGKILTDEFAPVEQYLAKTF